MDLKIFETLSSLPSLNSRKSNEIVCTVCEGKSRFFDIVDFNKCCSVENVYEFGPSGVPVCYFRCNNCGLIFTPFFDDWQTEDFSRFIYNDDYKKVDSEYLGVRPIREAVNISKLLAGRVGLRILDYGSGSGIFAQHLQGHGFQSVLSYDPFSSPTRPSGKFDIITCFEVLEHAASPKKTMSDIASFADRDATIIFSTGVQPANINETLASWWYIAPRNGHISIYTLVALEILAYQFDFVLHAGTAGMSFHRRHDSAISRYVKECFGTPTRAFYLGAPESSEQIPAEQASSWHSIEQDGHRSFRWTRQASISWRLQQEVLAPCLLIVNIGLCNEVESGFSAQCYAEVGDKSFPLVRHSNSFSATIYIEIPTVAVFRLVTPPPLRPSEIRAVTDSRLLGVAILALPSPRKPLDQIEGP